MPEVRVDPLTGLRTLVAEEGATALDPAAADVPLQTPADLFTAVAARGTQESVPGGPDAWRERMRAHADCAYVHVSATAPDGPAELFALDFVPAAIARERERFGAYAVRTMGQNLLGDLVQEEVRRRERLVAVDDEAVVFAPYGSRVPFQLLLAPRRSRPRFEDDGPTGAALLADACARLDRPLDLWVRTAPRGADAFCWRIDILPRAEPGGLERGTGLAVCTVSPEAAAAHLRDA